MQPSGVQTERNIRTSQDAKEAEIMKNAEGYPDPTAGDAIRACGRMPTHIYNIYSVINNVAGLHGLEITGLRDKKTGKEWRREPHG